MADRRQDDFRCERQRANHYPGSDCPIIRSERCAASVVIEELPFDSSHLSLNPTRTITSGKSPRVFPVADVLLRVSDGVILMHISRLPAVFKIIAAVLAHKSIANAPKVN